MIDLEWKGVVLPFIVVILSLLFSFGFMALMDWEISLVTILLPIMLIAIANDYGIHLINLYQEKFASGKQKSIKEVAISIYEELKKPILITALTTIGGMLGLLSHKLPPAAELGVLASVGIGLALLMSLFLIPVLLSFYGAPEYKKNNNRKLLAINRVMEKFAGWVSRYPKRVIGAFVIVAAFSVVGLFFLKIDTNVEAYFLGKSDLKKGIELVNEKFGGSQYVSVLFNGDVLSPEMLTQIEKYTAEIEALPKVGNVISPTMFLKELSKGVYMPNEPGYNTLPKTKAETVQYLEIFAMSGYEEQISQFIDYNYENTRILVSLKDGSNETGKAVLEALHKITDDDEHLVCIAGPGLSKIQIADMVIQGQITSLILAFIIIFVLLTMVFKSVVAGFLGSIPLLLSILLLFGLMGFGGISLDIVNTLLSSIMIGVGVDYTIHFLWRYKLEYAKSGNPAKAISKTLSTTGRGIIFNAFSIIVGFSALIFSGFAPLRFFGVLVVISIFACLISALLLIPAIITITKPKFLEPQ
ncbi:MAG: MMPL family transporter [Draconibacterium sp.]|nr:MMPL family transporter [Draconibacterium sp.]